MSTVFNLGIIAGAIALGLLFLYGVFDFNTRFLDKKLAEPTLYTWYKKTRVIRCRLIGVLLITFGLISAILELMF